MGMGKPASAATTGSTVGHGIGGHTIAIALLHQGHKALAVAVWLPLYVPSLLSNIRRAVTHAEALVVDVRAWVDRERRGQAHPRADSD
jgi:hypothetical protein